MTLDRDYFVKIQQLRMDIIKSEFELILSCRSVMNSTIVADNEC